MIEWLRKNKNSLTIRGIEKQLNMPDSTLTKAVNGTQGLPKKVGSAIEQLYCRTSKARHMTSAEFLKEYGKAPTSKQLKVAIEKGAKHKQAVLKRMEAETPTTRRAVISIDRLLPGLNGKDGLIRQNHFKATKVKASLLQLVKAGRYATFGSARVKIICTRYYCGTAMDFDNASASFKYLVDAIVKAGIIYDDSPKTIEEWTVRQVSVKSRKLQKMEVEISKWD